MPAHTARVDADQVHDYLGPPQIRPEAPFRTSRPGVATGLAWTETGGDVLFIEAALLPGGIGQVILTGQLGSVMQESARAALSHIRQNARELGISPEFLSKQDIHIHVPAGAIPKDGPSAGVTMATAIVSAARGVPVRSDVAMTGEITLSGLVLPVGGIREKTLAARRLGIRTIILPEMNEADLDELPEDARKDMTFHPVHHARRGARRRVPGRGAARLIATSAAVVLLHLRPRLRPRLAPDRNHQRARRAPARSRHRRAHVGPRWLFDRTARVPITLVPGECDTGVVQIDSLRLDAARDHSARRRVLPNPARARERRGAPAPRRTTSGW